MNLSDLDVQRALIVGDMHGNIHSWERTIIPTARSERVDIIVQVGDFGYGWDEGYLSELDALLRVGLADPCVVWLDGNHENFDALEDIGAFPGQLIPTQTSDCTWYLPRGYVWEWQAVRCMALGGAYSVDKPYRTPHRSWWPQEELTEADIERACVAGHDGVDIMFTHDAPAGTRVPGIHADWKQDEFGALCRPNRMRVLSVVQHVQPDVLVHGHFHIGYERTEGRLVTGSEQRIVGLNRESESGSMALLDLDPQYTIKRLGVPDDGVSDSRMGLGEVGIPDYVQDRQDAASLLVAAGAV